MSVLPASVGSGAVSSPIFRASNSPQCRGMEALADAPGTQNRPAKRFRRKARQEPIVDGECVVCPERLPAAGAKAVDLGRLNKVTGLASCFFTCGEACAKVLRAGSVERPKGVRVVENINAALVPLTGTRLRAGDQVEIVGDDLSPGRMVFAGRGIIEAVNVATNAGTTLKVRYTIGGTVVEVGLDDVEPRGDAAQRIRGEEADAGAAARRPRSSRISTASSPSSTSRLSMDRSVKETASLRAAVTSQARRAIRAEDEAERTRDEAERTQIAVVRMVAAAERRVLEVATSAEASATCAAKREERLARVAATATDKQDLANKKVAQVRAAAAGDVARAIDQRDAARSEHRGVKRELERTKKKATAVGKARRVAEDHAARILELEAELEVERDARREDEADAAKWRRLTLPQYGRRTKGGREFSAHTHLTACLLMATGCSAPVAEDAWRIILQRTLGDTAVEGKDYFVPCQDALKRARTINASIDEQMVGEALAKADVIDQIGCDETSLNGVSEQASFAKVHASAPSLALPRLLCLLPPPLPRPLRLQLRP